MAVGTWFATEFDEPAPALDVPGTLRAGQDRAFAAADQVVRGRRIVGRLIAADGMLAMKVRPTGRPVSVRLELCVDAAALDWWDERAEPDRTGGRGRPRLLLVRAQGALRRAVLLARNHDRIGPGDVRAAVTFDLDADEVTADGLLVIELADAAPLLPDWAAGALSPAAGLGVRVERVEITPVAERGAPASGPITGPECQHRGIASAGGLVGGSTRLDQGPPRTPFVVLNPTPAGAVTVGEVRCRLRTGTRAARRLRPVPDTWWTQSVPSRALVKARRIWRRALRRAGITPPWPARRVAASGVTVVALSLADGTPVPVRVSRAGRGRVDVRVAAPEAPVLLAVTTPGRSGRRPLVCELVEVES